MRAGRERLAIYAAWWCGCGLAVLVACERGPAGQDVRREPTPALAPAESLAAGGATMPRRSIEAVQEAHTPALMAIPGVVGTFIGETADGKPCIKIMVVERTQELERQLPRTLEGHPVEIFESGRIRPLGDRPSGAGEP